MGTAPTVTNTFTAGTKAKAGQVNTNFSDIIAALTDGTKTHEAAAWRGGDGTVSEPSFAFLNDTNTGLLLEQTGSMGIVAAGSIRGIWRDEGLMIGKNLTSPSAFLHVLATAATARIESATSTSDATLLFTNGTTNTGMMGVDASNGIFAIVGGTTTLSNANKFFASQNNRFGVGTPGTGNELFTIFDQNTINSGLLVESQTNGIAYVRYQSVSNVQYSFMDTSGSLRFGNTISGSIVGFGINSNGNAFVESSLPSFNLVSDSNTLGIFGIQTAGGFFHIKNRDDNVSRVFMSADTNTGYIDVYASDGFTTDATIASIVLQNQGGQTMPAFRLQGRGSWGCVIDMRSVSGNTTTANFQINFGDQYSAGYHAGSQKYMIAHSNYLNTSAAALIMETNGAFVVGGDLTTGGQAVPFRVMDRTSAGYTVAASTIPTIGDEIIVANRNDTTTANAAIGILAGANGISKLNFGDTNDIDVGYIHYDHSVNSMIFGVSATAVASLDNTGVFQSDNGVYTSRQTLNMGTAGAGTYTATSLDITVHSSYLIAISIAENSSNHYSGLWAANIGESGEATIVELNNHQAGTSDITSIAINALNLEVSGSNAFNDSGGDVLKISTTKLNNGLN
jgi:hypothetical protein